MRPEIYYLKHAQKGIGRGGFPQSQRMRDGYDYASSTSVQKLTWHQDAKVEPDFEHIVLMDGAARTDLISCVPVPASVLVVSERLMQLLTSSKIPPHQVYEAPIMHKGERVSGYYGLHIPEGDLFTSEIDLNRSKLYVIDRVEKAKLRKLDTSEVSELIEAMSEVRNHQPHQKIWVEELVMREGFYEEHELFALPHLTFPVDFYVTQDLKDRMVEADCTGVEFVRVSGAIDAPALEQAVWNSREYWTRFV